METGYVLLQHWHLEIAVVLGFLLDLLLDDPEHWFHPACIIGGLVRELERRLYPKAGPSVVVFWNGFFLWLCCVGAVGTGVFLLTTGLRGIPFPLGFLFEILSSYQLLMARCLRDGAEKVARAPGEGGLVVGRRAVSYIADRDMEALDEAGVICVAIETVAENVSGGEVAPLLYLLLFGVTDGQVYKAVNTVDSTPGYKNMCYELFSRVATRMDDMFNWIPARVAVFLLIVATAITGQDAREVARISRWDRYRHASSNFAQTESVMVGVLGMRLAGSASYSEERKERPYIGDAGREIETEDTARVNRMLTAASWLPLFFFLAPRFFCCVITAKLAVSLKGAAVLLPLLF